MRRLLVMVVGALLVLAGPAWAKEKPAQSCGDDRQEDFDPGLESRTVVAGPVAFVPFRVQPNESANSPARAFKLAVRLDADTDAALRIRTPATSLLFDPGDFGQDTYRLDDGSKKIRITGCEGRSGDVRRRRAHNRPYDVRAGREGARFPEGSGDADGLRG